MLVELLQPASPDLARRWLAALLLIPREDREATVRAVEARVAELHANRSPLDRSPLEDLEVTIVHPPQRKHAYVEQVETTYGPASTVPAAPKVKTPRTG